MSYSDSFPSVSPSWQCNFSANGGRLDPRITFSRPDSPINSSNAPASAVHYWSNEKHLSSENLLTYSNPNDAAWSESGSTVTLNQAASPDGNTTASLITEDSSTGLHRTLLSTPVNSGDSLTVVGYLKANGRTIVQVGQTGVYGTSNWVEFDLSGSGTATTREGSPTGVTIAQVGSTGWYKVSYSSTTSSSGTHYTQIKLCDAANSDTYTGDNSSGVYAYGFNLSSIGQLVHEDTSGQRARQYAPTLKSVSYAGQPRFEYSASDSASMGLLIEGSSTNLIERSSELSNSYWTASSANMSVIADSAVGPDGQLADMLLPTNSSAAAYVQSANFTPASATSHTASAYVKAVGSYQFFMRLVTVSPAATCAEAKFTLSGDGTANVLAGSATISKANNNGWYRVSVTGTTTTTATSVVLRAADASGNTSFTADQYSGFICTGVQCESGSHASSLISTSGSAVTRAADSASAVTADIGYTGGPVSIVAEGDSNSDYGVLALLRDSSGGGDVAYLYANPNSTNKAEVYAGGVTSTATATAGTGKSALALDTNRLAACRAGGTVTTDTSTALPVLNQLQIGSLNGAYVFLNGHCKRIAIYGEALSDSNLQSLTK